MRQAFVLAAAVVGLWAAPAAAQSGTVTRERVVGLKLVDDSVFAEAYYNGSSFSGGGIMSAIATYQVTVRDAVTNRIISRYTEERNVSLDPRTGWSSGDPSIYDVEYGNFVAGANGLPDGLYIYGGASSAIGTTTVTVTFRGFTATGTITFWAD